MAHFPKPFFRSARQLWYVQVSGKQVNLGADKESAFAEYHRLMAAPIPPTTDLTLVVGVLDAFLAWAKKHRAPRTYEGHRWFIQRFINALPGASSLTVAEFKPFHVKNWIDNLPKAGDTHRRNAIRAIKRPFSWAVEYGYITGNPIASIKCPPAGHRENLISPEIYQLILTKTKGGFRDLLIFAWETGARPQELKRLEKRHFEPTQHRFHLPKEEAKGKKKPRHIYLTDRAMEIAQRLTRLTPNGPMFRNRKDRPWTTYALNCAFRRLKPKIDAKFSLYDFRHSFAHRMLVSGMDSLTVAELMGHSDLTMLKKVYGHLEKGTGFLADQLKKAESNGSALA